MRHRLPMLCYPRLFRSCLGVLLMAAAQVGNAQALPTDTLAAAKGRSVALKRLLIDVSGGAALPLAAYAARNPGTGTALNGGYLSLRCAYLFTPQVGGVCVELYGARNAGDPATGARQLVLPPGARYAQYAAGYWSVASALAGLQFSTYLFGNRWVLTFRPVLGGVASITAPEMSATYSAASGATQRLAMEAQRVTAFSWQTGVDARIRVTHQLYLRAEVSYFGSRPLMEDSSGKKYPQLVNNLNVGGGLSWELARK